LGVLLFCQVGRFSIPLLVFLHTICANAESSFVPFLPHLLFSARPSLTILLPNSSLRPRSALPTPTWIGLLQGPNFCFKFFFHSNFSNSPSPHVNPLGRVMSDQCLFTFFFSPCRDRFPSGKICFLFHPSRSGVTILVDADKLTFVGRGHSPGYAHTQSSWVPAYPDGSFVCGAVSLPRFLV